MRLNRARNLQATVFLVLLFVGLAMTLGLDSQSPHVLVYAGVSVFILATGTIGTYGT